MSSSPTPLPIAGIVPMGWDLQINLVRANSYWLSASGLFEYFPASYLSSLIVCGSLIQSSSQVTGNTSPPKGL